MPDHDVQQQMNDLAFQNSFVVPMKFLPDAWLLAQDSSLTWDVKGFPPSPRNSIPRSPGVYVFVVTPNKFDFVHSTGLFYVGKATSLYERIGFYIGQIGKDFKTTTSPHVWRMVNQWDGHLRYHFTITQDVDEAEALENEMLNAFRPPFNKRFYGETSRIERAF